MAKMTDAEALREDEKEALAQYDEFGPNPTPLFRDRLIEARRALREIIDECPKPKTGYGQRIVEIASNACKGGKP